MKYSRLLFYYYTTTYVILCEESEIEEDGRHRLDSFVETYCTVLSTLDRFVPSLISTYYVPTRTSS